MSLSRYSFTARLKNSLGENLISISSASPKISRAINGGVISYNVHVLEEGERLDY